MSTLTKLFVVLQLVLSIGLAVAVMLIIGDQKKYKDQVLVEEKFKIAAMAEATRSNNQLRLDEATFNKSLDDRKNDMAKLKSDLDSQTASVNNLKVRADDLELKLLDANANLTRLVSTTATQAQQLTARNAELDTLRPQVATLTKQNAELARTNNELTNERELSQKAIKTLQEALATSKTKEGALNEGGTPGLATPSTALNVGTPTPVQINGRVQKVQDVNGRTYVTLSLGTRDGVQTGNRFTIYRDTQYVGDAVVQRVVPDQAVAVVTMTRQTVKDGDLVVSGGGL